MFGMLDYRAHKLFRLLSFPLVLGARLLFFVVIAIAIFIAQQTDYSLPVKIVVAYVAMEGISMVTAGLWFLVMWLFRAIFFWLVDVIPSKAINEEEAREVVIKGRIIWLSRKLAWDIGNWTDDDTQSFISALNWRARMLFEARSRFEHRVRVLQKHYRDTGIQPGDLRPSEVNALVEEKSNWFQIAIVNPHYFNSILGACIIMIALNALR